MRAYFFFSLCLVILCAGSVRAQASRSPNIVVILADDLGYGDLSSYGAQDLQSPHIDALAQEGMRFDHFYANSPVCSPSRAALLSGRYPDLVGVPGVIRTHAENSWGYLSPDAILLPWMLRRAGYYTGMVGKWHLGLEYPNRPVDRGFDFFQGYLGDMMDDYYTHRRHGINYMRRNEEEIDPEGHATDLFTDWAISYIRERSESDAPFFLYLAYNAPHTPIQPPEDWVERVKTRNPGISEKRARLVALIEHMDEGVGRVVEVLKSTAQYENTLLLFTSDNGGQLDAGGTNGTLRGGKQEMYEGGLRVPMIAVWPGQIAPGSRSNQVSLLMDLFPTLAEVADHSIDHAIDGRSLLPIFSESSAALRERPLFFVRREGGNRYMGKTIWAVRQGDWKLLQNTPMEPFELYHLARDPREQNDLSGIEKERYDQLAAALRNHIQRSGAVRWQPY